MCTTHTLLCILQTCSQTCIIHVRKRVPCTVYHTCLLHRYHGHKAMSMGYTHTVYNITVSTPPAAV